jgi:hypothetical protein
MYVEYQVWSRSCISLRLRLHQNKSAPWGSSSATQVNLSLHEGERNNVNLLLHVTGTVHQLAQRRIYKVLL